MDAPGKTKPSQTDTSKCVTRSVVDVLSKEPGLEAVTINRAEHKISLATLGPADVSRLTTRLTEQIELAQQSDPDAPCGLLDGGGNCSRCGTPLSPQELLKITIRQDAQSTTIARVTCPTAPKFWRWRDIPLPKLKPREIELHDDDAHINEWKMQLVTAVLCGVFGLTGFALGKFGLPQFSVAAYVAAYITGAWFTVGEVWERLEERAIDVHFLMLAVAAGAACIGAWAEGATLLFLFSFSGALEHFALGRTQKEIRSLFRDAPKVATVLDDQGREREVKVEQLARGMRLLIKPGAQFPVDADIAKGSTAADESNLTGEAVPVEKTLGDTVLSGTINLWGAVEVVVTKPAAESSLQRIITLIKEAQQRKAPAQQFTDKVSTYYTYFALALSLTMFFVWWKLVGLKPFTSTADQYSAFYRTMTLLVVSSPCALVLSIPSAVLAAIAWGARHGILFRGGAAVEKLADVDTVALDKTGTLTTGELRVEKVESFPPGRETEIAQLAYSLEKLSTHPLARAITLHGKHEQLTVINLDHFESITGQGLRGNWKGTPVLLGKREWVTADFGVRREAQRHAALDPGKPSDVARHPATAQPSDNSLSPIGWERAGVREIPATDAGSSEVWLAYGDLLGRIVLRDDIRPQSKQVIEELRHEGLRSIVLTGDRKATAEFLRTELKLDDVRAELKPEQKVEAIRALNDEGKHVAMIGDGVNDAPSLAAAHIGVAMGARGSDAALEQADVVLMNDRLENFLAAFRLSQRARSVIRWNLFISLGTVVVLVCFALAGKIPLTIGVVGHEGSTVVVVMNSLRLLFGGAVKTT